ncbi:MAG: hypothetical protein ABIA74_03060 [bacterium]
MNKIFKTLFLILAINVFSNTQSNACGWLYSCPKETYTGELAKIGNVLLDSGKTALCLTLKDGKNLVANKIVPTIANNPYLLTSSVGLAFLYTLYLGKYPKGTIKNTFKYGLSPMWYPTYYTWKKLRQEDKIKSLEKRLEDAVKIKQA